MIVGKTSVTHPRSHSHRVDEPSAEDLQGHENYNEKLDGTIINYFVFMGVIRWSGGKELGLYAGGAEF